MPGFFIGILPTLTAFACFFHLNDRSISSKHDRSMSGNRRNKRMNIVIVLLHLFGRLFFLRR
jgi:hypothetical protein